GRGAVRAMSLLGPLNLLSATLVLAGGFLPGHWREAAWCLALAVQIASPYLNPIEGFSISAAQFVERHGLVVIIELGGSVVEVRRARRRTAAPAGGAGPWRGWGAVPAR